MHRPGLGASRRDEHGVLVRWRIACCCRDWVVANATLGSCEGGVNGGGRMMEIDPAAGPMTVASLGLGPRLPFTTDAWKYKGAPTTGEVAVSAQTVTKRWPDMDLPVVDWCYVRDHGMDCRCRPSQERNAWVEAPRHQPKPPRIRVMRRLDCASSLIAWFLSIHSVSNNLADHGHCNIHPFFIVCSLHHRRLFIKAPY
jgi:hypothetical protein